jgi:hypothetical protein
MGWSMRGILAGAGKGMSDWATAGMAADRQAERDAAQFERQKELQTHQDSLAGEREKRVAELKQTQITKEEERKQAKIGTAMTEASAAAEAAGKKPGSADYNKFMAEDLQKKGLFEMGDKYMGYAHKDVDDQRMQEHIRAQLGATAESRNARLDQNLREEDRHSMNRADTMLVKILDNYKITNPDDPSKQMIDPTMITAAADIRAGREAHLLKQAEASGKKPNAASIYKQATDFAISVAAGANDPAFKSLATMGDRMFAVAQSRADAANKKKSAEPAAIALPSTPKLGDGSLPKKIPY